MGTRVSHETLPNTHTHTNDGMLYTHGTGAGLALSSSAFVLQLLRDKDELNTRHGRAAFGILLFQDLAIVPILVGIPLLAGGGDPSSILVALRSACIKSVIALSTIAFIGRVVLDKIFFVVAKSKSQEVCGVDCVLM